MIVNKITEENLLTVVTAGSAVLALISSLTGFTLHSKAMGFGIAAGAGIALLNFAWQRSIMKRILSLQVHRPAMHAIVRYLLRLGITAIALYYLLTSGYFSLTGVLLGLSVVVITIICCTVYFAIQRKGD